MIAILSYYNLVVKFFLEDEVSSVWSILISCSSDIQSEVVVVMCVCAHIIVIIFKVNKLVNKVITCFCFNKYTMVLTLMLL